MTKPKKQKQKKPVALPGPKATTAFARTLQHLAQYTDAKGYNEISFDNGFVTGHPRITFRRDFGFIEASGHSRVIGAVWERHHGEWCCVETSDTDPPPTETKS